MSWIYEAFYCIKLASLLRNSLINPETIAYRNCQQHLLHHDKESMNGVVEEEVGLCWCRRVIYIGEMINHHYEATARDEN